MKVPFSSLTLRPLGAGVALLGLAGLAACGPGEPAEQAGAPQAEMQPQAVPVEIMVAEPQSVGSTRILPGRATPFAEAEIRPQVTGLIQARLFSEGAQVEEGEALYQIDASEYAAAVDSARAALERAEATAETARQTAGRFERLANINAVSQQAYDEAVAAQKQAEAEVGIQRAALQRAQIDLARTKVRSPIAGQIGRSTVTPGALVTANQAQPLARVLQLDPIYIDMTAASSEVLKWRQDVADGKIRTTGDTTSVPVTVRFENGSEYPLRGNVEFSEVSVDQDAGTVIVRAQVPNPDGLILPGMFVKAEFAAGTYENVYLVPQRAVQRTPRGDATAFVVNEEGIAELRTLSVQEARGAQWIVTGGLESGDRVIVDGLQNVRPGVRVHALNPGPSSMTAMTADPATSPE